MNYQDIGQNINLDYFPQVEAPPDQECGLFSKCFIVYLKEENHDLVDDEVDEHSSCVQVLGFHVDQVDISFRNSMSSCHLMSRLGKIQVCNKKQETACDDD